MAARRVAVCDGATSVHDLVAQYSHHLSSIQRQQAAHRAATQAVTAAARRRAVRAENQRLRRAEARTRRPALDARVVRQLVRVRHLVRVQRFRRPSQLPLSTRAIEQRQLQDRFGGRHFQLQDHLSPAIHLYGRCGFRRVLYASTGATATASTVVVVEIATIICSPSAIY